MVRVEEAGTGEGALTHVDVSPALWSVEAAIAGRVARQGIPAPRTLDVHEWPPAYGQVYAWRQQQLARFDQDPDYLASAIAYYSLFEAQSCIDFINHWCDTVDVRNVGHGKPVRMPYVMFRRQDDQIRFGFACMEADANGLIDKSRDMGATWGFIGFSNWAFCTQGGMAIGWGSNLLEQVDKLDEPDTIFEKLRMQLLLIPEHLRRTDPSIPATPLIREEHLKRGLCVNPDNGAVISGQGGKNIGRGGRRRVYFVDEAAHLQHPAAVDAALSENTRCRIDLSSAGMPGSVFDRTRESGKIWEVGAEVVRDRANVFVMDWTDHPEKTAAWHAQRTAYYANKGMASVVAREIDRNPMGAQEGIIIPYECVQAAVDAHRLLGFGDDGGWWGGQDVADQGQDSNALVRGRGVVVKRVDEWAMERDPGVSARRAFRLCRETRPIVLQYDCIGLGTNVKSEYNRLTQDDAVDTSWLTLVPWAANAAVLEPGERVIRDDLQSPINKNYFENFRAQAWWSVERMFYRTWLCVQASKAGKLDVDDSGAEGAYCVRDEDDNELRFGAGELISLDSRTIPEPALKKLMRELSQATWGQSSKLKQLVNKAPEGTKSPNLADALIMGRFPARARGAGTGISMYGPRVFRG